MEKTLAVINQMERNGVIDRYAIGGAIAATLYVEPIQTYDRQLSRCHADLCSKTAPPAGTGCTFLGRKGCDY
jgi:hypothetical protein